MNTNTTSRKGSWIQEKEQRTARTGILLLLLLTLPAVVQAQWQYTITNGAVTILKYTGSGGDVTIPDRINGLLVTSIGGGFDSYGNAWGAFDGCTSLTSVTIPNSVTNIGDNAFSSCCRLTSVTIPNSVTSIGTGAFYDCFSLTSVTTGNKVTSIADQVFESCASLTSVTIGTNVASIGVQAFAYCGSLTNLTIPDSVTSIEMQAFLSCIGLTSVTIPDGVTSIGGQAFGRCFMLSAITVDTLNPAYSSIDGVLFDKSQTILIQYPGGKAGSYTIPSSVASIGGGAFIGCSGLTNATIGSSVTSIGGGAFILCSSLTSVAIPNSVTSIGGQAFFGCDSLTNLTIGSGLKSIGYGTFGWCSRLSAITVDGFNSAFSSLDGVLLDKSQATLIQCLGGKAGSYTIPNSVTNIGDFAFEDCGGLTSVTIPNSVTSIGWGAFRYCGSLTGVNISDHVTSVAPEAFRDCSSLTNVAIGNGVTSIGDNVFDGCTSLAIVTIPGSVTNIGSYTFQYCTSLTNITIGNRVASIEDWAFETCTSLVGVYFHGNAPSLGSAVFYGDDNATVYYLPGTTGWGSSFGGRPTALWIQVPTIQTAPQTQTAEEGSAVGLWVDASSPLPLFYLWRLNNTNLTSWSTNCDLELTNVDFSQAGTYRVVVSNVLGALTSAPAVLNVIAPVERRPVPGINVTGQAGSLLNVDYANALTAAPNWATLGSVSVTSTSQYCFDLTIPLPPHRYYRARQTGTPGVRPSLSLPGMVPAITLTGNIDTSVRLDYINQIGPIDAWATLDTVPLTNTSQLYFDVSAWRQPQRLYRLVPLP
jgi:hypothetical protein